MIKATRSAIRRLAAKDYTCQEMRRYLIQNKELNREQADKIVDDLQERGFLNDERYASEKTQYYASLGYGREKILRTLRKKGIDSETIEQALTDLQDDQEEVRAQAMAQRLKLTVKDRSRKVKQQLIASKLIAQGYSPEIARRATSQLDLDDEDEDSALDQTMAKAQRLYAAKHSGARLQQKILEYCIRKGFSADAVRRKLEEQELKNDE